MTDPLSDLHRLLDRATDAIETPALVAPALRTARLRRTRRRGAAAALLVSGLVTGVVVATHLGGGAAVAPPIAPSQTPSTEVTDPPRAVEQPRWDPREVDDLPAAPDDVAPALPDTIDPPATSPALADDPIDAAVAAVQSGGTAQLLSTDGSWRSVPLPGRFPRLALSPDGTRLAVTDDDLQVVVHDLATGTGRAVSTPEGFQPWDFSQWRWADEQTLLLDDLRGGWWVDADTGAAEEVPYPSAFTWTIDPAGDVVQSADVGQPALLTDWAGGRAREVGLDGTLERMSADDTTVVGTTWGEAPFSVSLADRRTATPTAVLPILNPEDNYGKGGLGVLALADDGTVLLRVSAIDGREVDGFRVVAWEPDSGSLSLVTSAPVAIEDTVVFADGLIRRVPAAEPVEGVTGAPPIDPAVVQPLWDPTTVGDLPWDDSVGLPRSLDASEAGVSDSADAAPVRAVVDRGERLALWHASGVRTDLAYPEPPFSDISRTVALAPDGSWLAFAGRTAVWTSVNQGAWRRHDYPAGFRSAADFGVQVAVDGVGGLLLEQYGSSWHLDTETGAAVRLGGSPYDLVAATDGRAVGFTGTGGLRSVVEYDGGVLVSDTESVYLQSLNRPAASETALAAVRGVGTITPPRDPVEQNGLIAVERGSLSTRAYLPIRDPGYGYTDGGSMDVRGWLDDDVVLASVIGDGGFDTGTRTLFTWNVATGELRKVSELPGRFQLAIASGLPADS